MRPGAVAPVRYLGRIRLVAVGVNSVIGGGIFILPATVAALVGRDALLAYAAAAAVVLGVGLALGRLAARHDRSGGPYLYVHHAFGPLAGFLAGWFFFLARLTAMANLVNGFARYLIALAPGGEVGTAARVALVAGCAAAVTAVNVVGIRATSRVTNLLAVLKAAPLVLLGVTGLFFLRPENFAAETFAPIDFVRATLLLVYAFTGFEILTVPAEESHRPRRDMPYALLATLGVVSAIYLAVQVGVQGMLPGLGGERAPLATAAGIVAGPAGRYGMTAVAALSMAGCSLASLVGASRTLYAMSQARQVPAALGALHPRFRTPLIGSVLFGALAAVLAIIGRWDELAAVSSGARLFLYLLCCLACLPGAPAQSSGEGPASRRGRTVPILTAGAIGVLLSGLERREVVAGMIGIGAGVGLYLLARRERAGHPAQEACR